MVVSVNSFGQSAVFIKERFNASQNYVMKATSNIFILSYTVASYNPSAARSSLIHYLTKHKILGYCKVMCC
jgi:hypothetical protein